MNFLRYSSHSMGRSCFLAVLHVLQHGTTFPLVLFPPREIGTIWSMVSCLEGVARPQKWHAPFATRRFHHWDSLSSRALRRSRFRSASSRSEAKGCMDFLFFIIISHPLPLVARGAEGAEILYFSVSSEREETEINQPLQGSSFIFLTFVRIVSNKEACFNYLISHLFPVSSRRRILLAIYGGQA